jgi:HD-like signal output (HDOD) protein
MIQQAEERISKIFKSLVDIPSLPQAVQKLLKLSEANSNPREFAEIIEKDQGLTAKVLRLVNSAFYSLRIPVVSLRQASSLLGTKTLKSLALSVSVMQVFKRTCGGFDPMGFWRHAVAVAAGARKLGALLLPGQEEDLYVAGLLHDVGVALLVQYLADEYGVVLRMARSDSRRLSEVEEEMLGVTHAEVGYALASRWRLPPLVCECIRYHEAPGSALPATQEVPRESLDLICLVDRWCYRLGLHFLAPGVIREDFKPEVPSWLEAHLPQILECLETLPADAADCERFFFPPQEEGSGSPPREGPSA